MSQASSILAGLLARQDRRIDLSLGRMTRLLGRLGNPHHRLAPVVHIAGTNGKGSVLAGLSAFLRSSGLAVQSYTSPHLIRFNERIRLDNRPVDDAVLVEAIESCEKANADAPITVFEITTAAAFRIFSERPADIVLLETGLGGRFDATNVVDTPLVTVLTPIALDHQGFLGSTLADIAFAKAGIMKRGTICFSSKQPLPARHVLEKEAEQCGAVLHFQNQDWHWRRAKADETDAPPWHFFLPADSSEAARFLSLPAPALAGTHQYENAALALRTALYIWHRCPPPRPVGRETLERALRQTDWPGRWQKIAAHHPFVQTCLKRAEQTRQNNTSDTGAAGAGAFDTGAVDTEAVEIRLDAAHNPAAARAIARQIRLSKRQCPTDVICAMTAPRSPRQFLRPLCPWIRRLIALPLPAETGTASLSPAEIVKDAQSLGIRAMPARTLSEAMTMLMAGTEPGEKARIVICGSSYLAGHMLAEMERHKQHHAGKTAAETVKGARKTRDTESEPVAVFRKKLCLRSRRRGMAEMDLWLGGWTDRHIGRMDREALEQLNTILDLPDAVLQPLLLDETIPVPAGVCPNLLASLRDFAKTELAVQKPERRNRRGNNDAAF